MSLNLASLTIPQIKAYAKEKGISPPSALRKADLIAYIQGKLNEPSFGKQYLSRSKIVPEYPDSKLSWKEHLSQKGWVTVPIPSFDPSKYCIAFWDWLEGCCHALDRKDPSTWVPSNLPISTNGIIKYFIAQELFLWEIREACIPIFSELWGTEELLTSFDGGCFLPPLTKVKEELKSWAHFDHHRSEAMYKSVQGVIALTESGPEDGGLLVLEGSMAKYDEYIAKYPSSGLKWGFVNIEDTVYSGLRWVKVCCPAGHIMLFDSRCVHMNLQGIRERMVTYVSMYPLKEGHGQQGASDSDLAKRIKWFEEGRGTSHAAYGAWSTANPKVPYNYGKGYNQPREIKRVVLNGQQRKLVGYSD